MELHCDAPPTSQIDPSFQVVKFEDDEDALIASLPKGPKHILSIGGWSFSRSEGMFVWVIQLKACADDLLPSIAGFHDGGTFARAAVQRMLTAGRLKCRSNTNAHTIFPALARTRATRATFINSAIRYATDRKLHGIDLDWEYPNYGGTGED